MRELTFYRLLEGHRQRCFLVPFVNVRISFDVQRCLASGNTSPAPCGSLVWVEIGVSFFCRVVSGGLRTTRSPFAMCVQRALFYLPSQPLCRGLACVETLSLSSGLGAV